MYVIGTAGHVDHGKSLLVQALTGIDPDRLREEKARGMTIDLGFAWLTLPDGRTVSIVDVPGHERFIKNMLAGAGGVDVALLAVAADDGVMPQTREHLAILDLLGVARGVVALTKRDLVDDAWAALVAAEIGETLAGTTLAGSPVVACSATTGEGLDALTAALGEALDGLPPKRDYGRPRLPVDRVFTIAGFGTVVTGTLIDGELAAGDEIEAVPGGLRGRVRGVQSHATAVEHAGPGTRTAVNVSGIEKGDLRRGIVLAAPGALRATDVLDARVRAVAGLARPLRHNMPVTFHCFSDEANAQLRLLDSDELRAGESGWAQIKLATPVAALRGDRFVLRTSDDTVAGGVIGDVAPKRHRRRDASVVAALERMTSSSPEERVMALVAVRGWVEAGAIAAALALPATEAKRALGELVASGAALSVEAGGGAWVATTAHAAATGEHARAVLRAYHAEHPLRAGIPQEQLRRELRLEADVFAAVAASWGDVETGGGIAKMRGFAPAPSGGQREAMDAYLDALRRDGDGGRTAPPAAELLAYMVESGAVVDADDGIVFEAAAFGAMRDAVCARIAREGAITLAEARDLLGVSRKRAQAVLEQLDRLRVTRRVGDGRVLRGG